MDRKLTFILISCLFVLISCGDKPAPAPSEEFARPAKLYTVKSPEEMLFRTFPGEVRASEQADLAFRVGGEIIEFPVTRGIEIKKGQLLARLDPADYDAAVQQAKAEFDLASAQFERARELIDRKLISQAEYDESYATMQVSESALTRANNNLAYTHLYAPFDGHVARRLAENYESVSPGQVILQVQTDTMIDISVNVPESIVVRIERQQVDRDPQPVEVRFSSAPDRSYVAEYKEHETSADAATLTYRVTFSMPIPEDLNVLPGMSATVTANLSRLYAQEVATTTMVPIEAVFSEENQPLDSEYKQVWKVDSNTMRAHRTNVKVGPMGGASIAIMEGLSPGDIIIAAGVSGVQEGMLVRMLERESGL